MNEADMFIQDQEKPCLKTTLLRNFPINFFVTLKLD